MAQTFVGMARTWLAVAVIIFKATGGFGMGSGFVSSCLILPSRVVSASSGWTQIFEVCGLDLVQTHLFTTDLSLGMDSGASGSLAG